MLHSTVISKILANCTDVYRPNVKYKIKVFEYLNKSIVHEINMMKRPYADKYHKMHKYGKIRHI